MHTAEEIAAYYRHPAVRSRIAEYCGPKCVRQALESPNPGLLVPPLPHLLGGQPTDFAWILDRIPREGTGVCADTSHCALAGGLVEAIAAAGPRLVHVQASDNQGHTDDHAIPGSGVIDWPAVDHALAGVGYGGVFMLEVTGEGGLESCLAGLDVWRAGV